MEQICEEEEGEAVVPRVHVSRNQSHDVQRSNTIRGRLLSNFNMTVTGNSESGFQSDTTSELRRRRELDFEQ